MRLALALALALGLAVMGGAAQRSTILTNGRNLQIPINHGLPDRQLGFTFFAAVCWTWPDRASSLGESDIYRPSPCAGACCSLPLLVAPKGQEKGNAETRRSRQAASTGQRAHWLDDNFVHDDIG
jgi:hypothetical protein